jgi:Leucine-rich repeat (LRR) protein
VIENLENMISLEYLSLKGNQIKMVENLRTLRKLSYLDLSRNRIGSIDARELPPNMELLLTNDNPIDDAAKTR